MSDGQLAYIKREPFVNKIDIERHRWRLSQAILELHAAFKKRHSSEDSEVP